MKIWTKIKSLLQSNHALYLLNVVQSEGSAPGREGFKMIVSDNDELFGSIGGGIMEYNMVEQAKILLKDGLIKHYAIEQIHKGGSHSSSGMICSGSQIIAFNHLGPDDIALIEEISGSDKIIEYSIKGIKLVGTENCPKFSKYSKNDWSYCESIGSKPIVRIFGAGHVSVPTSQLLVQLGFDVFLYDNRTNINTFQSNKFVCQKQIIDYEKVLDEVRLNSIDYVLLMTHKFTEDKLLLSQLIRNQYQYLGVLGSKNKIAVLFDALRNSGFSQSQFDKIHAPIGVQINSRTTQEIAVSIVAELINVKNT